MNRQIIIGDIHGEIVKLKRLFQQINLKDDDQIIFLGDYIDRGVGSREVINFIIDLKKSYDVITLKGNHEDFAINGHLFPDSNMVGSWLMNGGVSTLNNYNFDVNEMFKIHGHFFNNLELIYETDHYIFVHGYLHHSKSVADQDECSCLWSRFDNIKPHKSGKTVVVGHTIHGGVVDDGYKICIDTGSYLPEGYITALIIDGDNKTYLHGR